MRRHEKGCYGVLVERDMSVDRIESFGTKMEFEGAWEKLCMGDGLVTKCVNYVGDVKIVIVERVRG